MYVNLNMCWSVIVFAFWDLLALIPMQWRPPNHALFFSHAIFSALVEPSVSSRGVAGKQKRKQVHVKTDCPL